MKNTIIVSPMRREHLKDVWRLNFQLGYSTSFESFARRFKKIAASPQHKLLVALDGGKVIGWLQVSLRELLCSDFRTDVVSLVVDKDYRGRGAGRKLMAAAEKIAARQGSSCLALHSGMKRRGAHKFYKRLGYENTKRSKLFVKQL